jgi:hypothetical protein
MAICTCSGGQESPCVEKGMACERVRVGRTDGFEEKEQKGFAPGAHASPNTDGFGREGTRHN